jgi:Tfp pilus assembly protein PilF
MRLSTLTLAISFALLACGTPDRSGADPDAQAMTQGLAELQANRPAAAEQQFRAILARTPTHYGAHFQLAVALDRQSRPAEARAEWETVRAAAAAISDSATLRRALARLAAPDTLSQEQIMAVGLNLLYTQNKAADAVAEFRKVLQRNPTHYGATYQMATALDRAGKSGEARPFWVKTLGMATSFNDAKTISVARERLKN